MLIDLHTHFLPGIDDGAKDTDESLNMLKEAYRQGVRILVATPHAVIHSNNSIKKFIVNRTASYNQLLKTITPTCSDIPCILMGAEVYLDNNINQYDDIEALCIENTRAMLIELPLNKKFNPQAEEWIYELSCKKIKPVIAHIDRYPFCFEMMDALGDISAVYQINSSAFLTMGGRSLIKKLLKRNKEFIISSDMHNTHSRKCTLYKSYEKSLRIYENKTNELFMLNAKRILNLP